MSMEITAVVIGGEKVAKELQKKGSEIVKENEIAIKKGALLIEATAKKSMRGTGTPHTPSAPGEPPAVEFNLLRASITHQFIGGADGVTDAKVGVRSGDDPDKYNYGFFLEFGTSKMHARPFLLPALNKSMEAIKRFITQGIKSVAR